MRRRISFSMAFLASCALLTLACGKTPSESERKYTEACVKFNKGESYRKICECSATIVAPKLTPGELNAYINSMDLLGKPMTEETVATRGFTLSDFTSLGQKRQASFEEMRQTCGGEI